MKYTRPIKIREAGPLSRPFAPVSDLSPVYNWTARLQRSEERTLDFGVQRVVAPPHVNYEIADGANWTDPCSPAMFLFNPSSTGKSIEIYQRR